MDHENHYQVIIIGGGIGGLMLGAILRRQNIRFRILERSATLTPQGAGISLAPNCLKALDQLGVFAKIAVESQELYGIDVFRNTAYWGRIDFGLAKEYFGYRVHSVERYKLNQYLYAAADGRNTVTLGFNVTDIIDDTSRKYVDITDDKGQRVTADVVVGADGIRSVTRRILAKRSGLEGLNTIRFTGRVHMSGYTTPLKHLDERAAGIANYMLYDDSIFTTWPCKENRRWFIGAKKATLAPGETPDRSVWKGTTSAMINAEYGAKFHPFGEDGSVKSIVECSERVVACNVFEEKDFPTMSFGRVALIGDAAHSMTSFFGQGGCQAIEDAVELANALHRYFKQPDTLDLNISRRLGLEDVFVEYRRSRETRAKTLARTIGSSVGLQVRPEQALDVVPPMAVWLSACG